MASDSVGPVYCRACGAVDDGLSAQLQSAYAVVDGLERDLRAKRAAISRLEGQRVEKQLESPLHGPAVEVLAHWREVCMPGAREFDSVERVAKVIARLNGGRSVEELKRCADGYGRRPFVVKGGKRRSSGLPTQRFCDAELVYRDDAHVSAGLVLAEAPEEGDPPGWDHIDWRRVRRANHKIILGALRDQFGTPHFDDGNAYTRCPRCGGHLTLFSPQSTETLLYCACGIDERAFLRGLVDD